MTTKDNLSESTSSSVVFNAKNADRDSATKSIWEQEGSVYPDTSNQLSQEDSTYDVLIIGGGITGLTTALLAQEQGLKCILAEAHKIGFGSTGGTTSHINTMLDNNYSMIEEDFGLEVSKLVGQATKQSIEFIHACTQKYSIDCDFEYKTGYLYAQNDKEEKELTSIYEASKRAEVAVSDSGTIPVPIPFQKAIAFHRQAQIHPVKYLHGLATEFLKQGGIILENTFIKEHSKEGDTFISIADSRKIKSKQIVYATHIPPGLNILHMRCAPYRSYVLAVQLSDNAYPSDLAYDMKDPYHYFRSHTIDDVQYMIVGGDDHKTGHGNPQDSYRSLEDYVRKHFNIASIEYKWSSQFYESADGLPYIGKLPGAENGVYCATGFSGNGITYGAFSGILLSDLLLGKETPYEKIFSPFRIKPVAGFMDFVKENTDVAYHFIADRFSAKDIDTFNEVKPGEGMIVEHGDKKLAVYRDESGKVFALSPVCTHAKCIVNWNNAEKSWDCPCHGGRFDVYGRVLNGPPSADLEKIEITE